MIWTMVLNKDIESVKCRLFVEDFVKKLLFYIVGVDLFTQKQQKTSCQIQVSITISKIFFFSPADENKYVLL
jgi:hypothetical protein